MIVARVESDQQHRIIETFCPYKVDIYAHITMHITLYTIRGITLKIEIFYPAIPPVV